MDRELPIIFSTAMVRAILEGKKTQTRRVLLPQPRNGVRNSPFVKSGLEDLHGYKIKPSYYPGDRLYVRESFCLGKIEEEDLADGYTGQLYVSQCINENDFIPKEYCLSSDICIEEVTWKPSIHMPKKNTRIWLEVTGVKCTRLQDISAMDCIAEGIERSTAIDVHDRTVEEINKYRELWDSLNARRGYGWDKNPWVWVIEFKKVLAPSGGESEGER